MLLFAVSAAFGGPQGDEEMLRLALAKIAFAHEVDFINYYTDRCNMGTPLAVLVCNGLRKWACRDSIANCSTRERAERRQCARFSGPGES